MSSLQKKETLLIVDDSKFQRVVIRQSLGEHFNFAEAVSGEECLTIMEKESDAIDLVLLDLMLPGISGEAVLEEIRKKGNLPVIVLTAKDSLDEKVEVLTSGADDYIPKPFRMMELISRIKAALRRAEDKGAEEYRLENLYVSPMKHVVMVDQEPVSLTLKEYEMLCLLLKNSGMVLSRTQLLNQIWGYEFDGESRTVDVHIRTLRQKLGSAGDLIETVRGVGYKIGK